MQKEQREEWRESWWELVTDWIRIRGKERQYGRLTYYPIQNSFGHERSTVNYFTRTIGTCWVILGKSGHTDTLVEMTHSAVLGWQRVQREADQAKGWEAEWLDERPGDNKLRFVDFKVLGDIHLGKKQQSTLFQTPMGTCLECGLQAWKRSRLDIQHISFDPVMPLSEIWNSEILNLVQNVLCVRKLAVALFAQSKIFKQYKGPPIRNWLIYYGGPCEMVVCTEVYPYVLTWKMSLISF